MHTSTSTPSVHSASRFYPWFIWLLGCSFYFYENLIQVSPGVMSDNLINEFGIHGAVLGSAIAFFFYAYAPMQMPVGVLVDNYNVRYLLTGATLSCVAGCFLFAIAPSIIFIGAGRFFIGFGAAFAAVCTMKIATNWFTPKQFSLLVGFMVTIGMSGSIFGQAPLAHLVENVGWRQAMATLAFIGLFLAALIVLFVRHSPTLSRSFSANEKLDENSATTNSNLLEGLKLVLTHKQSWWIAIYGGLMFATTSIFGGLWGVPFFQSVYGLSKTTAAELNSMLFFGWVFGAPLSGILVRMLSSHKFVMLLSSIVSFFCMFIIIYVNTLSINMYYYLTFALGLFSSFFLPSFTLMALIHSKKMAGSALGFMNMANMVGGALGQPLVGYLLDTSFKLQHSSTVAKALEKANDLPYNTLDYQVALSILPLMMLASIVLWFFIEEKSPDSF
ncbi:MFS transporter [Legionella sp. W05-934-2]|uniref:MFS transporter n=1 Tax=Legionella sp. W05-934-2 TaxID=1198649 RepID=UPI003462B986